MPERDSHGRPRQYLYRHNPRTRSSKSCQTCSESFQQRGAAKYCSRACSSRSRIATKVNLVCLVCGEDYPVHPYRADSSMYCSRACWSQRARTETCHGCGVEFTAYGGGQRKYCSKPCAAKHMVGARSPAWKGGVTADNERARHSAELRAWRLAVYRRDGFRCQDCGTKGELHAHHVKYWSTHPELRFEVSNGKTLCVDCHGRVHGRNFRSFKRSAPSKTRHRPEPRPAQNARPSGGQ